MQWPDKAGRVAVSPWGLILPNQLEATEVPFKEQLQACRSIFVASEGEPGQENATPEGRSPSEKDC